RTSFKEKIYTDEELLQAIRNKKCTVNYQKPVSIKPKLLTIAKTEKQKEREISVLKLHSQKKKPIIAKKEKNQPHFFDKP
ncbi:MAG: hypothetical protein U9O98_06935, partial [Asgard group archaeon]|nr:hypothetical protein [Asgard group archaeon]